MDKDVDSERHDANQQHQRSPKRRPGCAAARLIVHGDFHEPLELIPAKEEKKRYVIVDMEGGLVHATQVPEGVDLVVVDADAYLEPPLDSTRADLEPYERLGLRAVAFRATGKTLGGDDLRACEEA